MWASAPPRPPPRLHLQNASGGIGIKLQSGGSFTAELQQSGSSVFSIINGGSERLSVRSGGNVGVGTTTPDFLFEVNGDAAKPGGGSWTSTSDMRLKKNINDLDGALDRLLALRGVAFEYKDPEAINELPGERIGVIAQEVEEVFPDWVGENGQGYKTVTFRGFEAVAVEALRDLRSEKDTQIRLRDQRLDAQQDEIAALRAQKR